MIRYYILLFFAFSITAGCSEVFNKTPQKNIEKEEPGLLDSSDIVTYVRFYLTEYHDMMQTGTIDVSHGEHVALKFIDLATQYPDSRYADDALFFAAKLYYEVGKNEDAALLFTQVFTKYSEGMMSAESNRYGYTFHIAPLAHLYYAMTIDYHQGKISQAAGEYTRILQRYAKHAEERYLLDDVSGNVAAEAQFNSGYAHERLKNYMIAIQEYMRTVLRYSGYYLSKHEGERNDYADMALKRIYIIATGEAKQPDQANIYLREMLNQQIFSDYFPKIRFYLGAIALDQRKYADAIKYYREIINAVRSSSFKEVDLILATLDKVKYIESLKVKEVVAESENLTEYLCKSILHGKDMSAEITDGIVSDLLAAEVLLYISTLYYEQGKQELAVKYAIQVFQRYPYLVSSNGEFMTVKTAALLKKILPEEEYITTLRGLITFIPDKYEAKLILWKELQSYATK